MDKIDSILVRLQCIKNDVKEASDESKDRDAQALANQNSMKESLKAVSDIPKIKSDIDKLDAKLSEVLEAIKSLAKKESSEVNN